MALKRKIYTARDLSRNPARVFEDTRTYGETEIRTRDGETFVLTLQEEEKHEIDIEKLRADFEKLRLLREKECGPPPSKSEMERFDRIIAGEE